MDIGTGNSFIVLVILAIVSILKHICGEIDLPTNI